MSLLIICLQSNVVFADAQTYDKVLVSPDLPSYVIYSAQMICKTRSQDHQYSMSALMLAQLSKQCAWLLQNVFAVNMA